MKSKGMWAGLMLAASLAITGVAMAADGDKPKRAFSEKQLAQQQRMKDCSADAKEKALKGPDRKAFMKTCLSGGSVTATAGNEAASAPDEAGVARKEKMKACNADAKAKALKGAERKTFMSDCLAM